jgi:hypothetical protein
MPNCRIDSQVGRIIIKPTIFQPIQNDPESIRGVRDNSMKKADRPMRKSGKAVPQANAAGKLPGTQL